MITATRIKLVNLRRIIFYVTGISDDTRYRSFLVEQASIESLRRRNFGRPEGDNFI